MISVGTVGRTRILDVGKHKIVRLGWNTESIRRNIGVRIRKVLNIISPWRVILLFLLVFFCGLSQTHAMDVTLEWDANTQPDRDGYKIYYTDSVHPYNGTVIDVDIDDVEIGDVARYTVTVLSDTDTYFFVVTAYDTLGNESGYSNKVSWQPITTDEDTPVIITLVGTDTYDSAVDSGPSHGQLSSDIGSILTYTPYKDYNGPDSFTFRVNDGETHVFTGIVSINVTAVNDPPTVIVTPATSVNEDIALGGGDSSGCFIATAAFGSNMDRHVQMLSEFRDNRLLTSPAGHRMVDLYYKFSPSAACFLRQHPTARVVVRYSLIPLTGVAYLALYIHPIALLFGFILLVLTGVYCGRRFSQSRSNFSQP